MMLYQITASLDARAKAWRMDCPRLVLMMMDDGDQAKKRKVEPKQMVTASVRTGSNKGQSRLLRPNWSMVAERSFFCDVVLDFLGMHGRRGAMAF